MLKANVHIFGEAVIEWQGQVKFEVEGKEFEVYMTMYNSKSSTHIQKHGVEKPKPSDPVSELEGITVAKY